MTWVCVKGAEASNQINLHEREITIEFQAVNFDSPELNQKADMLMKQYEMIRSQYEKKLDGLYKLLAINQSE